MKILIACEESQAVCIEFRNRGHEAFSCDLQECSGGHPEWHIKRSVLEILDCFTPCLICGKPCIYDDINFSCKDCDKKWNAWNTPHEAVLWDLMIAFPPCTHLAVSGAAWFEQKRKDGRQQQGVDFFMAFTKTNIPKVCIENPVGIMSKIYRKPDQIIHPYYFGDEAQKTTCLWLKNLPKLFHAESVDMFNDVVTHVDKGEMITFPSGKRMAKWYALLRPDKERGGIRSKTFPGIARAMANTWG